MKKLGLIIALISVSILTFGQRENTLPLKTSSEPTDTIRVVKDNQSALMLRSTLTEGVEFEDSVVTAKNYKYLYSDTVDMDDYYDATYHTTGASARYPSLKSTVLIPNTQGKYNFLHYSRDSIWLVDNGNTFANNQNVLHLNGNSIGGAGTPQHISNITRVNDYRGGADFQTYNNSLLLYPDAGDTIDIESARAGYFQLQTYTPYSDSRVAMNNATVLRLFSSWDDYTRVGDLKMLSIAPRSFTIPTDSIDNYYGIKHEIFPGGELSAAGDNYFLYSEFGDNYLNGDLAANKYNYANYEQIIAEDSTVNIFISKTGDDTNGDGTRENPFATFKKASDLAPNKVHAGNLGTIPVFREALVFNLGAGTWNWSDIEPYLPVNNYYYIIGDTMDVVGSLTITRESDTIFYSNISTAGAVSLRAGAPEFPSLRAHESPSALRRYRPRGAAT